MIKTKNSILKLDTCKALPKLFYKDGIEKFLTKGL